jgi:stage II sporulation protein D
MLPAILTALAVAAAPLEVRILELEKPGRVTLEGKALTCNEQPLKETSVELRQYGQQLEFKETRCDSVTAVGEVTVRTGEVKRRYPGKVRATIAAVGVHLVNEVELEDYLPGVVGSELAQGAPAALEAQAVVSRTFAASARERHGTAGHDLCDTAHCQLYRGREDESDATRAAVKRTAGQVLLVGGVALRPAYFHAACGGATSRASDVFGELGVSPGVSDLLDDGPACKDAEGFRWSFEVEKSELARVLGGDREAAAFTALRRDGASRAIEVMLLGKRMSGNQFVTQMGQRFGWKSIRSARVTVREAEAMVRFEGTGLGHGVGLCQHGAMALAKKGLDAQKILKRYFPDRTVRVP